MGARLLAVERDLLLALATELRQRLAAVVRAAHARVALAVLGSAPALDQRLTIPEALEEDPVDLDLLGVLHEGCVPRPVDRVRVAHVDLVERPQEDVLVVDARAQPLGAQRARELDRGVHDRLLRRPLAHLHRAHP